MDVDADIDVDVNVDVDGGAFSNLLSCLMLVFDANYLFKLRHCYLAKAQLLFLFKIRI